MKVPYRLHAVLVHEGQASAGHYWAYIYDHANQRWMKYNDVIVSESSWEELVRDSFGGYRNASAYCLMYINDKKPFLIEGRYCVFCCSISIIPSLYFGLAFLVVYFSCLPGCVCRGV